MKRFIFLIIVLCTTVFSMENNKNWADEMYYHGALLTEQNWTKIITQNKYCERTREYKLMEVGRLSAEVLFQHPDIWLKDDYLKYVNDQCELNISFIKSKKGFEDIVYSYINPKKGNKIGDIFMGVFFVFFVLILMNILFGKQKTDK